MPAGFGSSQFSGVALPFPCTSLFETAAAETLD